MSEPRKLLRCTIKEEFVALTGDAVSAAILNQMIFWQELVNKSDQEILAEIRAYEKIGDKRKIAELRKQYKNGWFWKAAKEMADEVMFSTRATVDRKMRALVEKRFIDSKPNPDRRYVTNFYHVNLAFIQSELAKLGFSLEGYALPESLVDANPKQQDTTYGIDQNEQYHIQGVAQNEQGVAQNEQGVTQNEQRIAQNEQVINYLSLGLQSSGFQSLGFEEEEVYTGRDPLILVLLNVSKTKAPTIRHEAFLQNLTAYNIRSDMALKVVEYMASQQQDINSYTCDAIDRTFSEFVKRSQTGDKIKVFPRWFAATIVNKQFEVDQDEARADERRREEERLRKRLERYVIKAQEMAAATNEGGK